MCLLLACRPETVGWRVPADPHFIVFDEASPRNGFDGEGGSLFLGAGWAPPEEHPGAAGDFASAAWVLGTEATVRFRVRESGEFDLVARCFPLSWAGSPRQTLRLSLNGFPGIETDLPPGWTDLRIPLPGAVAPGSAHRLDFRLRYAARPAEVGLGPDQRLLSVAFAEVAVVPRRVANARALLDATRLDPAEEVLHLPVGGSAAIPLAPGARVSLSLPVMADRCAGCRVAAEQLVEGSSVGVVAEEELHGSARLAAEFATAPAGRSLLRLRVIAGQESGEESGARFDLVDEWLMLKDAPAASAERPNLLIFTVDTLRADALEPYGADPEVTPRIAEFARQAVVYDQAWAASSWTLPSVVSLLTGVYPFRHGIMKGDVKLGREQAPTLAARLAAAGYDTFAFSQSPVISADFGLDSGMAVFQLQSALVTRVQRAQEARWWLFDWLAHRPRGDQPFFAYLHSVDPHDPYSPRGNQARFAAALPTRLQEREYSTAHFNLHRHEVGREEIARLRALYQGEVSHTDAAFGALVDGLRTLGELERTLIVLVADHGEEFGEHGGFDHGRTAYEEMLRVPLIIRFPGAKSGGTRVSQPVSLVDLAPTLLAAAGVETTDSLLDGIRLEPTTLAAARRAIFSEVSPLGNQIVGPVDLRALRVGDWKCVQNLAQVDQFGDPMPEWSAFDLAADPSESISIGARERCAAPMAEFLARRRSQPRPASAEPVDAEARERLRALGYLR